MANRAKKHHIVPRVLQKEFAIPGDTQRIWRTKRDESQIFRSVERKPIENVFIKRDYYTVLEHGDRSDRVERNFYGEIDDFLGRFLPKITDILKRGEVAEFPKNTLDAVRLLVMEMAKRTPDFLERDDDVAIGRNMVEKTLQALPDDTPAEQRDQMRADLKNDIWLRDQGRDIRVLATLRNSPRVEYALSLLVPRWAVSATKHSFILTSRMVYRIGNGGPNGLANPNLEMWMPLTPKIALVLIRTPETQIPDIIFLSPSQIRKINEYAVRNSFEIASHSEALLKSLIKLQ